MTIVMYMKLRHKGSLHEEYAHHHGARHGVNHFLCLAPQISHLSLLSLSYIHTQINHVLLILKGITYSVDLS